MIQEANKPLIDEMLVQVLFNLYYCRTYFVHGGNHYLLGYENCDRMRCIVFRKYEHPLVQIRHLKLYPMLENS